jgi:hypothetical protein
MNEHPQLRADPKGVAGFSAPQLLATAGVAVLLALGGSRYPVWAYGTLALILVYLLLSNVQPVAELVDDLVVNFAKGTRGAS